MKTAFILRYLISYLLISPLFPMVFRVGGVGFTPILHHFAFLCKQQGTHFSAGKEMSIIQHATLYSMNSQFSIHR